jgi:uncharacterized protein YxeA
MKTLIIKIVIVLLLLGGSSCSLQRVATNQTKNFVKTTRKNEREARKAKREFEKRLIKTGWIKNP